MLKLAALKTDKTACKFLNSVLEMENDNVFCRFLEENEVAEKDEIAVTSWSGSCPGKYFRTANHVLHGRIHKQLKEAKAFLGIKKIPPPQAIKGILADMRYWPKIKVISTPKKIKKRSIYFGAW